MTYHERVLALRAESKRTAFDFRFEDLFSKEEWLSMSLAERQKAEKAFRHEVKNMDDVRMPFSSVHDAQVKLYNVVHSYNGIKRNFKQVENEGF
ncbi:TPA: single-stranded DNA-binding protein [Staphylococcus aureus]|nr:single-stranded DNA-binding protein [Staphylococcus aureus]HDK4071606.1 single-stranded DNA-binding protein [Staphylococcus aureus]